MRSDDEKHAAESKRGGRVVVSVIGEAGDESPATATSVETPATDIPEYVIEVSGLHASYDGFEAVRGIDLQVSRGEIFTFLGPNGAGKTTTVEILEGHRKRTAGEARVLVWASFSQRAPARL